MQKGFAQPFLIVAGLLILVIGGVYFYQGTNKSISKSATPVKENPIKLPKLSSPLEPEFKDYTSHLGFTFKYGKDLSVKEDTEGEFNKRGGGDFRKNFKGYVTFEPGKFLGAVVVLDKDQKYETNPLTLWVFDNPQDLSIDEWYKSYWYYPFVWGDFTYTGKFELAPKTESTISGQMAKSGVIDYQPGKPKFVYCCETGTSVHLSKDKKMYLFRIIGENGDKILQSFKFN